jgi:hypothetical protein
MSQEQEQVQGQEVEQIQGGYFNLKLTEEGAHLSVEGQASDLIRALAEIAAQNKDIAYMLTTALDLSEMYLATATATATATEEGEEDKQDSPVKE